MLFVLNLISTTVASRLSSPLKLSRVPLGEDDAQDRLATPMNDNWNIGKTPKSSGILHKESTFFSSRERKKTVSISKDSFADFSAFQAQSQKPSRFSENRSPHTKSRIPEEDTTMNLFENVCDSSLYVSKETEMYKKQLQSCVYKFFENLKKMVRVYISTNILRL